MEANVFIAQRSNAGSGRSQIRMTIQGKEADMFWRLVSSENDRLQIHLSDATHFSHYKVMVVFFGHGVIYFSVLCKSIGRGQLPAAPLFS